jgi:hypothetical protein
VPGRPLDSAPTSSRRLRPSLRKHVARPAAGRAGPGSWHAA